MVVQVVAQVVAQAAGQVAVVVGPMVVGIVGAMVLLHELEHPIGRQLRSPASQVVENAALGNVVLAPNQGEGVGLRPTRLLREQAKDHVESLIVGTTPEPTAA